MFVYEVRHKGKTIATISGGERDLVLGEAKHQAFIASYHSDSDAKVYLVKDSSNGFIGQKFDKLVYTESSHKE